MYCRYTPGFPIILAAWIRLFGPDAAHYIDPVLFLALLGVHLQLSRRVFAAVAGARWLALGGTLLLLLLPSYLHLWAITILRDISAQLFALTAILLAVPRDEPMSLRRAAAIGFFLGYLISIRIDAGLFALPIGILFLWQRRRRGTVPVAATLFVTGVIPLLAFNYAATGNPFRPTQAMELERFFQTRRAPSAQPMTSVAALARPASADQAARTSAPRPPSEGVKVAAPSPAPTHLVAADTRDPRLTVQTPAPPPVHGGGLRISHLRQTLPGNVRYLRNAFGNVILFLAILGAATAIFTNRWLFLVTVPYCLEALLFYSCWSRPDPRYIAGIFVLTPILALGGFAWLTTLGQMLRSKAGRVGAPLLAVAIAGAFAMMWRPEVSAMWTVVRAAWEAGAWRGGSALPMVSGGVGLLAIMTVASTGFLSASLARARWPAVALVALLLSTAVARSAPGWNRRASFQAPQVEHARRTIESIMAPGSVVVTTDEIGRPAENIDYYTHAHALYLRDLERWRWKIQPACATFLMAGHDVYLLLPTASKRGRDALEQLRSLELTHLIHVEARDAPSYFVASRFGTYPLDLYRLRIPAALREKLSRN